MEKKEERIRAIANSYYSRKDILEALFKFSKEREISPRYFEGFGKRPDSFQYPSDIIALVKRGATSFHCSEELWHDVFSLSTELSQEKLNELRKGWDLVIDIDCKWIDYSKKAAQAIVRALESRGVKNIGVKFSVSGDTPILIENNKEIKLIPISDAIKTIKQGSKLRVLSLDKNRKLTFSEIYGFLEHKDKIYEIYHSQSKLPVKATKYHSVFIWDKGEIIEKEVEKIKRGDFLVTFNAKANPLAEKAGGVQNNFIFNNKELSRNVDITPDIMRLIGYFLAEGHITNIINQVGFSFNKNEKEYIEDCQRILSGLTGKTCSIRHPNENSTQILIHSKEWSAFFDDFCGKKKEKHIPDFSWTLPKDLFIEMLRGYIRGDGYKVGKYGIVVKSVSKRLITEFLWLCKLNGISCSLSQEYNKPHKLPQGTMFRGSLVYLLKIPKSEIPLEFFRARNKFSPFQRDRTFPIDGLKEVYMQVKPKMFNHHRPEQMTLKKKCANIHRIKKVLEWFSNYKSEDYTGKSKKIIENYNLLFNSDIGTIKINNIIEKEDTDVFDISVKDTEAFFGNYYPILLHNSGSKGFHIIVPYQAFPEEIDSIKTKDMFPEWPRAVLGYIKEISRPILQSLIKDMDDDFANVKGFTGIKCENCSNLASEEYQVTLRCDKCYPPYIETFKSPNKEYSKKKCPNCKNSMKEISAKKFYACHKCSLNSLENSSNFNEEIIATDIFKILGLDLQLVSSRHLFRMPYSLHEKTSLASIVIDKDKISEFNIKDASPLNVKIISFMPDSKPGEARDLLIQAIDWSRSQEKTQPLYFQELQESDGSRKNRKFEPIVLKEIKDEFFPPSINKILKGMEDGRKRGLFILLNFFRSLGMPIEDVEKRVNEWNLKNNPQLKQGYINSQLIWHSKQKPVMPPNFDNEIYKEIGAYEMDSLSEKTKNPVSYVIRKSGAWKDNSWKKTKKENM